MAVVDIVDRQTRSWIMSQIKGKHTRPELCIRAFLHRLGYRFTVNGPKNRRLPGKPDIVLPKHRAVVFVHGCFWHAHEGCRHARLPKSRTEWWAAKFERNRERDRRNVEALEALGWNVVVIWTCEFDTQAKRELLAIDLPDRIETGGTRDAWMAAAEDPAPYNR